MGCGHLRDHARCEYYHRVIDAPNGSPPWAIELVRRINADNLNRSKLPVFLPRYAKANLPSVAAFINCWIYVTDDTGGAVPAFSDGTNWRRCQDRNVIS